MRGEEVSLIGERKALSRIIIAKYRDTRSTGAVLGIVERHYLHYFTPFVALNIPSTV